MTRIRIASDPIGEVLAEIAEDRNPRTARAIVNALPFEGRANRWGDEIYFKIPVTLDVENGQENVEVGDIAYWPPGASLCIFFGPTPVSKGGNPRAYSPVNVVGRILNDPNIFRRMQGGENQSFRGLVIVTHFIIKRANA